MLWSNLGGVLGFAGRDDEAEAAHRRAVELDPDSWGSHNNLGSTLQHLGRFDEAMSAFRRASELAPDQPNPVAGLADVLFSMHRYAEAETAFPRAIQLAEAEVASGRTTALQSIIGAAHGRLGTMYSELDRPADAEQEYRRSIDANPLTAGGALIALGGLLMDRGELKEAEKCFRRAELLQAPITAGMMHYAFGKVFVMAGRFDEAVAEYRLYREWHGQQKLGFNHAAAQWVREAEQMAALAPRIPGLLSGQAQPANTAERVTLAEACWYQKKRYALAAHLFAEAFGAEPLLTVCLMSDRFYAACSAAAAGCGQGEDSGELDDAERSRWRRQALDWLTAELAAWSKPGAWPPGVHTAAKEMRDWRKTRELSGVRGDALAKLPDAERVAWQKFWADVEALKKHCEEPAAAAKPAPKE